MKITGNIVNLRPISLEDAPFTFELRLDYEGIKSFLGYLFPVNIENEKKWITEIYSEKEKKNIYFAIEKNDDREFIGYISAKNINYIHRHADFGIILLKKFRGKGYASEAMKLFFNYLFNDLNLHKIKLEVLEDNFTAIKLYEKIGFVKEGLLKEHIWQDGKFKNLVIMSLFSTNFKMENST